MSKLLVNQQGVLKESNKPYIKHNGLLKPINSILQRQGQQLVTLWPSSPPDLVYLPLNNNFNDEAHPRQWLNGGTNPVTFTESVSGQQGVFTDYSYIYATEGLDELNFLADDDFTVEFIITPTSLKNNYASIITNYYHGWGSNIKSVYITLWGQSCPNSLLRKRIGLGSYSSIAISSATYTSILMKSQLTVDTRYHIAITRKSGTFRLFVNGVLDAIAHNNRLQFNFAEFGRLAIGTDNYNTQPSRYLNAYLDEVRICKYCRYDNDFTPPA